MMKKKKRRKVKAFMNAEEQRKVYVALTTEQKLAAVAAVKSGSTTVEVARELNINRNNVLKWMKGKNLTMRKGGARDGKQIMLPRRKRRSVTALIPPEGSKPISVMFTTLRGDTRFVELQVSGTVSLEIAMSVMAMLNPAGLHR